MEMIAFGLTSSYFIEEDFEADVRLYPDNALIEDYIATYRIFADEQEAIEQMPTYIAEMTPILYGQFMEMDNIPLETREQFYLP